MIIGTGVDLVQISRIDRMMKRWGDRFIRRVFTKDEAALCLERPRPASALALRFAAKEAFSKAVGLGMRKGIRWRDIEVYHHSSGKPGLRLWGPSREISRQKGATHVHLSLSDEGQYGIAMVVLEGAGENKEDVIC
jgi:holo-[acyl-carrier protein] synthase